MTQIYIAPEGTGESNEMEELAHKAGVPVVLVEKLFHLVQRTDDPIIIARMKTNDVVVLMRHLSTLLPEIPTVLINAPGSRQSSEFMSVTASLPSIDWTELSSKLAKSGLLSQTTEQAEERNPATMQGHKANSPDQSFATDMSEFASRARQKQQPKEEEETFDESQL